MYRKAENLTHDVHPAFWQNEKFAFKYSTHSYAIDRVNRKNVCEHGERMDTNPRKKLVSHLFPSATPVVGSQRSHTQSAVNTAGITETLRAAKSNHVPIFSADEWIGKNNSFRYTTKRNM